MTRELPPRWSQARFSEVASIASNLVDPSDWPDAPHIAPDNMERDTGRLLPYRTIHEDGVRSPKHRFFPGQLLYSKIRPYLNKCVRVTFEGLCSADMYPIDAFIAPTYLHHYMLTRLFVSDVSAAAGSRTVLPKTNQTQMADVLVPVAPLPEQHRIVEALGSYFSRLDEAVATLERVQRNLERYRASVLKAAVEGRLVPTEAELARAEGRDYEPASVLLERLLAERRRRWEEAELGKMTAKGKAPTNDTWKAKYKEPAAPDTSELPELPEGWCWASLPQLGELNRGKSKHRPRNDPRLLGGPHPFIQTGDVRHSAGFITGHSATYSEFGLAQSRLWPAGTLCITIAANIAETGILKFDACFPDSVVGFLNEANPTLVRFVELFIRTAKEDLERYAPATAQKNINLKVLSEVAVPLPPGSEQARLVAEVDRLLSVESASEGIATQNIQRATRLRQSILKWAFEGRLADQDPDDEPASVLLERIRAERAAAEAPRRRRGRGRKAGPQKELFET